MWPIPKSIEEALLCWDRGDPICSIETGGLGPGDEQATQTLMIEIIRAYKDTILPMIEREWRSWANDVVKKHRQTLGEINESQEYIAKTFAFHFLALGWPEALKLFNPEKYIIVRRFWPKAHDEEKGGDDMVTEHT